MAHGAAGSMSISICSSVPLAPKSPKVIWMGPDECVHIQRVVFFSDCTGSSFLHTSFL